MRGAERVLGLRNWRCHEAKEGRQAISKADISEQGIADDDRSCRNSTSSFFCPGVRMIYGELSMLITFLCYHESKQGDRDILKKSQSVTQGVDNLESRRMISNMPIPGYS